MKNDPSLIPSWINSYIKYTVWDEITFLFPDFNGTTVEVWEWISNFIPHFTRHVITYPCLDWSSPILVRRVPVILLSGPSKAGFTTAGGQASNVYYRIAISPYELTVITFIDIIIILIRHQNKCHPEMFHAWWLLSLYLVLLCADYCKVAGRHHVCGLENTIHGICSLSGRTSYRKISRSLEAVRLGLVFSNRS